MAARRRLLANASGWGRVFARAGGLMRTSANARRGERLESCGGPVSAHLCAGDLAAGLCCDHGEMVVRAAASALSWAAACSLLGRATVLACPLVTRRSWSRRRSSSGRATTFGASRHWTGSNSPAGARSAHSPAAHPWLGGCQVRRPGSEALDLAGQVRVRPRVAWRRSAMRGASLPGECRAGAPRSRAAARESVAPSGVASRVLATRSGLVSIAASPRFALPGSLSDGRPACHWHDPAEPRASRVVQAADVGAAGGDDVGVQLGRCLGNDAAGCSPDELAGRVRFRLGQGMISHLCRSRRSRTWGGGVAEPGDDGRGNDGG